MGAMNRRKFLTTSSLAVAAGSLSSARALAADPVLLQGAPLPIRCLFTKGLEQMRFPELADFLSGLPIAGIEAPLRRGGHIEPEAIEEFLPEMVAALQIANRPIQIAASDIDGIDRNGATEKYLRALKASGITRYRLAHLRYDLDRPLRPQIEDFRARLTELAALNRELGIQGQYQNHRGGDYVGAPIWDMVEILREIPPQQLGLAYDFAHGTVEGSNSWRTNVRIAADHIVAFYFKDYAVNGKRWEACPLGEGMVSPDAGKTARSLVAATTPLSLHIEYLIPGKPDFPPKLTAAAARDLATLE